MNPNGTLKLPLQTQKLVQDGKGYKVWQTEPAVVDFPVPQTAILICDMWDRHWSRGAEERGQVLTPQINRLVKAAREHGIQIIHSPSDTMDFYRDHASRRRLLDTPAAVPPDPLEHVDPPMPIDSSDEGSDTGEQKPEWVWTRQTAAIEIDAQCDVISGDEGPLVYSFLRHKGIQNLIYVGVHTNFCVLNRSFGIKRMTRWGVRCILVRDLTDTMYNPQMPPYVSHEEGTKLVVEYIEKFWCPTTDSKAMLDAFGGEGMSANQPLTSRKIVVQIPRDKVDQFMDPTTRERIAELGEIVWNPLDRAWTVEELKEQLHDADAVVTSWGTTPISEEVLGSAPKLRLVAHMAGSVKPVVTTMKAYDRGVTVLTSNHAIAVSVSEAVLTLILAIGHKIVEINRMMKEGGAWNSPENYSGLLQYEAYELRGRVVGLVGLGLVAREVIKLLRPFDVKLLAYDPFVSVDQAAELGVELVGLHDLMLRSDIVSLHAPKVPETDHMIGKAELDLLRDGSILINTARGCLIDEQALVLELRKKRIYVGLDVFEVEPLPLDSELRRLDNALIIPHLAGVNPDSKLRIGKWMTEDMRRFFNGEPLWYEVKKEQLAIMT